MKHLGVWQLALGRDASPSFPAICRQCPILVKWREMNSLSRAGFTWEQGWMLTWVGFFTREWIFNLALQWDEDHVNVRVHISAADPDLQIKGGGEGRPPVPSPGSATEYPDTEAKIIPNYRGYYRGRKLAGIGSFRLMAVRPDWGDSPNVYLWFFKPEKKE